MKKYEFLAIFVALFGGVVSQSSFIPFLVLVIGFTPRFIRFLWERSRTSSLQKIANDLGFELESDPKVMPKFMQSFPFLDRGFDHKFRNHMWSERKGVQVHIFGFEYTLVDKSLFSNSDGETRYRQTLVLFKSGSHELPGFILTPECPTDHYLEITGFQKNDIDFEEHGAFSMAFELRGSNENAIRQAFQSNVMTFMEQYQHLNLTLHSESNMLLCYEEGSRAAAEDLGELLKVTENIYHMLAHNFIESR